MYEGRQIPRGKVKAIQMKSPKLKTIEMRLQWKRIQKEQSAAEELKSSLEAVKSRTDTSENGIIDGEGNLKMFQRKIKSVFHKCRKTKDTEMENIST